MTTSPEKYTKLSSQAAEAIKAKAELDALKAFTRLGSDPIDPEKVAKYLAAWVYYAFKEGNVFALENG